MPVDQVIHAKEVLAVADGYSFIQAARLVGRKSDDAVAHLIACFNAEGLSALETRHGGGPPIRYSAVECERILREFRRPARWHRHLVAHHLATDTAMCSWWPPRSEHLHDLRGLALSGLHVATGPHLVRDR
jgi:hypothetical protein